MKREFHIGPGAASLILIIVILSLSVLSVMTLTNARGDERLTARSATVVEAIGNLNVRAEKTVAQLDEIFLRARQESGDSVSYIENIRGMLPQQMEMKENIVSWAETDEDGRKLCCSIEILPMERAERFARIEHRLSSEFAEMELEDIWN